MYYYTECESPVGPLLLAGSQNGLHGLWMKGQKYFAAHMPKECERFDHFPVFEAVREWLELYFSGQQPQTDSLSLAPVGSPFQQTVWSILLRIPYGQTMTYGEVAGQAAFTLGKTRMSAQATGGAVGHNPISIIIPCHRVVGKNGSLTGYAGGIQKKLFLLNQEGVDTSRLFIPSKGTAL